MKRLLLIGLLFTSSVYAADVYEKIDGETIKITRDEPVIDTFKIQNLKGQKANIESNLISGQAAWDAEQARLEAELVAVDADITEAAKLGVA